MSTLAKASPIHFWLLAMLIIWQPQIAAAETQPTPVSARQGKLVDTAQITKLSDQAKQDKALDETTRGQVMTTYSQALEQLELSSQWQAKAAEFEAARLQAPELLRSLSAELGLPAPLPIAASRPGADLAELTQQVTDAEVELETVQRELADLKSEKTLRSERRLELPNLLASLRDSLDAMKTKTEAIGLPPALAKAQEILKAARREAIQHEITAYQQELLSYEARGDLLEVRIELADRRVTSSMQTLAAWSQLLDKQRSNEAEAALQEAERQAEQAHPALQSLAKQNLELTRNQRTLTEAIEAAEKRITDTEQVLGRLETELKRIEERVEAAGLTNAIGQFLRRQRADLPNPRKLQKRIRELKREVGEVQSRILELEDQRNAIGKLEPAVAAIMGGLSPEIGSDERTQIEYKARELLRTQRECLNQLIDDQGSYFTELIDLDVMQRRLLEQTRRFARYIDENVLWIESGPLLGPSAVLRAGEALLWLVRPEGWRAIAVSIWGTMRASPLLSLAFIALVGALLGFHNRLRRRLQTPRPAHSRTVSNCSC